MKKQCNKNNSNCKHFTYSYEIGFKIFTVNKGDCYHEHLNENHNLVFLLNGEAEFSYNHFINRRFLTRDIFFIPQGVEIDAIAITDAKMLILNFNNKIESLCDRYKLFQLEKYIHNIEYDFKPLKISDTLSSFVTLMEMYINMGIKCSFLHELKQKELFVIMGAEYTPKELLELFYPIVGANIEFKKRIIENYRYGLEINVLATKLGMSYSPFLRKFKKEFGESMQEWMLKQKAKHIKAKLSNPTVTISDIVNEFNFTDTSHFYRFCRKQFDCNPTELLIRIRADKTEE